MPKFDREETGKQGRGSEVEEKSVQKKPYEKPSFRWEKVFETQSLTCGKVQTTQGECRFNRKVS